MIGVGQGAILFVVVVTALSQLMSILDGMMLFRLAESDGYNCF